MQNSWLNKIQNLEAPPVMEAWQYIATELDKENKLQLKTKMLAYEAHCPANVFANIFYQLDNEAQVLPPAFVKRIRKYIQTSPAIVWQNILNRLNKDEGVIQFYRKQKKINPAYLRIAVAAAVIALVWITVISINKKNMPVDVVQSKINETKHPLPIIHNTGSVPVKPLLKNEVATVVSNKTIAAQSIQPISTDHIKAEQVNDLAQLPDVNNKEKLQNAKGETPMDIALLNTPNANVSAIGASGQSAKVSSKFSNLVNNASSNPRVKENLDIIIEESPKWRAIIEAWRTKMANNCIGPSPANFMNMIELNQVLQEKD